MKCSATKANRRESQPTRMDGKAGASEMQKRMRHQEKPLLYWWQRGGGHGTAEMNKNNFQEWWKINKPS